MLYRAKTGPSELPPPEPTHIQSTDQARDDDYAHLSLHNFKPHRAPIITGLGIVGILTCWMFGIVGLYFSVKALRMANDDLKLMDQNLMDPTGRLATQTGQIFGVFGVLFGAMMSLVFCGYGCLIGFALTGAFGSGWLD